MQSEKYPQLEGICKRAIEYSICTGCNKLELRDFTGMDSCENIPPLYNKLWGKKKV